MMHVFSNSWLFSVGDAAVDSSKRNGAAESQPGAAKESGEKARTESSHLAEPTDQAPVPQISLTPDATAALPPGFDINQFMQFDSIPGFSFEVSILQFLH